MGVSEVNVVGVLAQFGARVIHEVSNKIFAEFTASFQKRLQEEAPAEAAPLKAGPPVQPASQASTQPQPIKAIPLVVSALWAGIVRFLRRLFGRSTAP